MTQARPAPLNAMASFRRRYQFGDPRSSASDQETGSTEPSHARSRSKRKYESRYGVNPLESMPAYHRNIVQRFQLRHIPELPKHSGIFSYSYTRSALSSAAQKFHPRHWRRLLISGMRYLEHPIHPDDSTFHSVRGLVMIFAFIGYIIYFPYMKAYQPHVIQPEPLERVFDVIFLADCLVVFNVAYVTHDRSVEMSRRRIALRYITSWLLVDIVVVLPTSAITGVIGSRGPAQAVSMFVRLIKTLRAYDGMYEYKSTRSRPGARGILKWFHYSRFAYLMGIIVLAIVVILITHFLACIWETMETKHPDEYNFSDMQRYLNNFYFASLLLQGDSPNLDEGTQAQNLFATMAVVLGSLIMAVFIGNVSMLVFRFSASSTTYRRKMESIYATMDKMELPHELRDRIHQYYEHLRHEYESLDGNVMQFSRNLSRTLALEVRLFKYADLISAIPLWSACSNGFIAEIVSLLDARVYLPDDYIVRKGELGDRMFMINRGVCDMLDADTVPASPRDDETFPSFADAVPQSPASADDMASNHSQRRHGDSSDLDQGSTGSFSDMAAADDWRTSSEDSGTRQFHSGASLGELALLMNYRRTASVRANTFLEVCILHRNSFQTLIKKHPIDRRLVFRAIITRAIEHNVFRNVAFDWHKVGLYLWQKRLAPSWHGSASTLNDVHTTAEGNQGRHHNSQRHAGNDYRQHCHRPAFFGGLLTTSEIVEGLVDEVDVDIPDDTIVFGFQSAAMKPAWARRPVPRLLSTDVATTTDDLLMSAILDGDTHSTQKPGESTASYTMSAAPRRSLAMTVAPTTAATVSIAAARNLNDRMRQVERRQQEILATIRALVLPIRQMSDAVRVNAMQRQSSRRLS